MSPETLRHPAPERHRIRAGIVLIGLAGAPLAWVLQMLVSEILSSYVCYPHDMPLTEPAWPELMPMLGAVSGLALIAGICGSILIWRAWRPIRHETGAGAHYAAESGEGRTRFLVACGIMSSAIFTIAIVFAACAFLLVSPCRPWF